MGFEFNGNVISSTDHTEQPFRAYLAGKPMPESPIPLVICLHGKGVDHNAWFDCTAVREKAVAWGPCLIASPYARGTGWYRGVAEQDVLDLVNHLQKQQQLMVNPKRIYLTGHSMGGFGTQWISARNPGIFAATAPMAGFSVDKLSARFSFSAKHTNPFIIHDADDDIVPADESRRFAAWLSQSGWNHRFIETKGYAHSSQLISDYLPKIFAWFDEHQLEDIVYKKRKSPKLMACTPEIRNAWNHLLHGLNQRQIAEKLAKLLTVALKVDAALLHEQDVTVQPLPICSENLQHLFAHPHAGVDVYELPVSFLKELLQRITFSPPVWVLESEVDQQFCTVAIAQSISTRFKTDLNGAGILKAAYPYFDELLSEKLDPTDLLGEYR
ncbi:MAG: prolyl oligopeptidase family serine peptidase [Sumerlaeia bacterium]